MQRQIHKVFIAYTTRLFAEGIESIIKDFEDFSLLSTSPICKNLDNNLANNSPSEILILELNCPGTRDLNLLRRLKDKFPHQKILLLSLLPRKAIGIALLESGIMGYLLKSCSKQDLLTALNKFTEDKPYFCSDITMNLLNGKNEDQNRNDRSLTDREKEILSFLVDSQTNKQIARKLKLSENTIKTHRRNIQTKFGVSNLLGMVRYACRSNLIDFGDDEFCLDCPFHLN